ncbi:MAG: hypothetical protein AB1700_09605 [Bacillota bacterium]
MKWIQLVLGVGTMVVGLWLLLYNLGFVSFVPWHLWPLIPLGMGILLHGVALSGRESVAALVPGGLLTVLGILFFACQTFGWDILEYLWPVFPLAVGVGFLEAYLFGGRRWEFLIPAVPTLGVGLIGLSSTLAGGIGKWLLPATLVAIGVLILLGAGRQTRQGG